MRNNNELHTQTINVSNSAPPPSLPTFISFQQKSLHSQQQQQHETLAKTKSSTIPEQKVIMRSMLKCFSLFFSLSMLWGNTVCKNVSANVASNAHGGPPNNGPPFRRILNIFGIFISVGCIVGPRGPKNGKERGRERESSGNCRDAFGLEISLFE
ncbi:hypothetical protein CDAR_619081 [Caerostris darwini]|uniref:Transmembrane protein n=1 Tax=Caerostris darwini TaxID=1538125 RepID=A0AAV4U2I6_9ARAC|nr:hypothetical protein CDAR_619081 [Caerostris darwini]